jgi:hypothetical protein
MVPSWIQFEAPTEDVDRAIHVRGPIGPNARNQAFVHGHVPPGRSIDFWLYSPDHVDGCPPDVWASWAEVPSTSPNDSYHLREISTMPGEFAGWSDREPTLLDPQIDGLPDELNRRWMPPTLMCVPDDMLQETPDDGALDDIGASIDELRDCLIAYHQQRRDDLAAAIDAHEVAFAMWRSYATSKTDLLAAWADRLGLDSTHRIRRAVTQMREQLDRLTSSKMTNEWHGPTAGHGWRRVEDNVEEFRSWLLTGGVSPKEAFQRRWIERLGSDHLRLAVEAGRLDTVQPQFYDEFLAAELPEWTYVHQDDPLAEGEGYVEVRKPTDTQLRALRHTQQHLPVAEPRLATNQRRTVIYGTVRGLPHRMVAWDEVDFAVSIDEIEATVTRPLDAARREVADAQAMVAANAARIDELERQQTAVNNALRAVLLDRDDAARRLARAQDLRVSLQQGGSVAIEIDGNPGR